MFRAAFMLLIFLCFCISSYGQATDPQVRTLEAVLSEIRLLRQDLQVAAIASRRAQITIYRLHLQQGVLERAVERRDETKNQLEQWVNQKRYQQAEIARFEELRDKAETEQMREQYAGSAERLKSQLEQWAQREQELQTQLLDCEAELRLEQSKWERLDSELDRLVNSLEVAALESNNRR